MAILDFILRKKHELAVVIDDSLAGILPLEEVTTTFFGEGTDEEYNDQVIADKGLAGIFGIERGGNNAP